MKFHVRLKIQFDLYLLSDFVQQVSSHKKLSVFATPGRHTFLIPINRGFEVIDLCYFFPINLLTANDVAYPSAWPKWCDVAGNATIDQTGRPARSL